MLRRRHQTCQTSTTDTCATRRVKQVALIPVLQWVPVEAAVKSRPMRQKLCKASWCFMGRAGVRYWHPIALTEPASASPHRQQYWPGPRNGAGPQPEDT